MQGGSGAERYLGTGELERVYPELTRFVSDTDPEDLPADFVCEDG